MADPQDETRRHQWRASDPTLSAFVSANAGSGKTHVLVARVVRLMLAGTPPARILCLTFTRAAAAEMAERLFSTLAKWLEPRGRRADPGAARLCGDVARQAPGRGPPAVRPRHRDAGRPQGPDHPRFLRAAAAALSGGGRRDAGLCRARRAEAAELLTEARDQVLAEIFDRHDGGDGALFAVLPATHRRPGEWIAARAPDQPARRRRRPCRRPRPGREAGERAGRPAGRQPLRHRAGRLHQGLDRATYGRLVAALEAMPAWSMTARPTVSGRCLRPSSPPVFSNA